MKTKNLAAGNIRNHSASDETSFLSKDQLKDLVRQLIRDELKIQIEDGHWTNPNQRIVKLFLGQEEIGHTQYFDVSQKPEYGE